MNISMPTDRGPYIHTSSGLRFYPFYPKVCEVRSIDIINGLANKCRFSGQTNRFYSILDHSIRVMNVVKYLISQELKRLGKSLVLPNDLLLKSFLHDSPEAYLADIPTPIKPFIFGWREAESSIQLVIHEYFGLQPENSPEETAMIKMADHIMVRIEADELFTPDVADMLHQEFDDRGMVKPSPDHYSVSFSELSGKDSYRRFYDRGKVEVMKEAKTILGIE